MRSLAALVLADLLKMPFGVAGEQAMQRTTRVGRCPNRNPPYWSSCARPLYAPLPKADSTGENANDIQSYEPAHDAHSGNRGRRARCDIE
jgi:hypothetical protein